MSVRTCSPTTPGRTRGQRLFRFRHKVQTLDGYWLSIDGRILFKATVAASEPYKTALETTSRPTWASRSVNAPTRIRGCGSTGIDAALYSHTKCYFFKGNQPAPVIGDDSSYRCHESKIHPARRLRGWQGRSREASGQPTYLKR